MTDYFQTLYQTLSQSDSPNPWTDLLQPWIPKAKAILATLQSHRHYETAPTKEHAIEDLWEWYALNRVNDYLLLSFSPETEKPHSRQHFNRVSLEDYQRFYGELAFEPIETDSFSPIRHEIVTVIEDNTVEHPIIERIFWPGFSFGEMVFSRAGIGVRAPRSLMRKAIAESSTLYFTYCRNHRPSNDQSHGWGHNSQWRTRFRRDYQTANHYHYNIDGDSVISGPEPEEDLSEDERIELLINRCFIKCDKASHDLYPYDDRLSVAQEQP